MIGILDGMYLEDIDEDIEMLVVCSSALSFVQPVAEFRTTWE